MKGLGCLCLRLEKQAFLPLGLLVDKFAYVLEAFKRSRCDGPEEISS